MTSESMKYVCMSGSLGILKRSLYTLPHVCERKHFIRECCSSFFVRQARGVSFYHLSQLVEHAFPFRIREFASRKFDLLSNSNRIVSLRNNLEGCCWACAKAPRGPLEIKQRTSRESAKLMRCFQFTLLSSLTKDTHFNPKETIQDAQLARGYQLAVSKVWWATE